MVGEDLASGVKDEDERGLSRRTMSAVSKDINSCNYLAIQMCKELQDVENQSVVGGGFRHTLDGCDKKYWHVPYRNPI